jgi:hypothetical protein
VAEWEHDQEIANPEWAYGKQLQDSHAEMDMRDQFDIPGDPTSQQMAMFANAAHPGQRSQQYVALVVKNEDRWPLNLGLMKLNRVGRSSHQSRMP